ncbi:MAG: hypothetical protein JXP73_10195 [Deltaproteobacteria bacterium]|nr:hypothetical protein [Deltaproteobacteria bacterium]
MTATKAATDIRHRIQHLDEDIFEAKHCQEGHPVLGAVSWSDTRFPSGYAVFGISSGPTIDGGKLLAMKIGQPRIEDGVGDFCLMAADQDLSLDAMVLAARQFMAEFEVTAARAIKTQLREAARSKGVSLEKAGAHQVCDMVTGVFFVPTGDGRWTTDGSRMFARVEVPPGVLDLES